MIITQDNWGLCIKARRGCSDNAKIPKQLKIEVRYNPITWTRYRRNVKAYPESLDAKEKPKELLKNSIFGNFNKRLRFMFELATRAPWLPKEFKKKLDKI